MTHASAAAATGAPETNGAADVAYEHYPLYCYHLSPTITAWCPLRARDIHELAERSGFEGQDDTFFHLNHPIRWVRVVGVVVAIDKYYGRRVYTVDDSSGACIECVATVPEAPAPAVAATADPPDPYPDVDVGRVVEARGSLGLYRGQKQIKVARLRRVASSGAEVAFWHKIRAFGADVLARPWAVDPRERRRLDKEARRDVAARGADDDKKAAERRRRRREERSGRQQDEDAPAPEAGRPRAADSLKQEARRRRAERAGRMGGGGVAAELKTTKPHRPSRLKEVTYVEGQYDALGL